MTIKNTFLEDGIGLEVTISGLISVEEIIANYEHIYEKESCLKRVYQITDYTQADAHSLTSADAQRLANSYKYQLKDRYQFCHVIIASDDLIFGLARVFDGYTDSGGIHLTIKRSREEALTFIKEYREHIKK